MADLEDIGVISGIGNYSPSGGIITPNASPYQKILSGSSDYRYFVAPLSNKGNATSPYGKNSIVVSPTTPVRLVDIVNGKVVYEGVGYDAAENVIRQAEALSKAGGNKAGWEIQAVPPGSDSYAMLAREKVNPGTLDIALQVLSVAAQIGVAVATSGASLTTQMAAAAATSAATTIARGGSLGDAIKAGVMAAAPVLGARELGPMINKGLSAASSAVVGKAIGAGISSVAAGALTGQSLEQMATSGLISGITTAVMPDIQKAVRSIGGAASATGGSSGGGGGTGGEIIVTGSTAPGGTITAINSSGKGAQNTDAVKQTSTETPENLLVEGSTAPGATAGIGNIPDSTAVKQTGVETPENLLVEGEKTTGATATTGSTGATDSTAVKQTGVETPENLLVEGDQKTVGISPDLSLNMSDVGNLINSEEFQDFVEDEIAKDPDKKGLTTSDWIRLALLAGNVLPYVFGGGGDDSGTAGIGTGGGRVNYVPLNRTQNVATGGGGQAGLGSYGFNPFTYGQAGLGQPEEYLFFGTPTTRSTGAAPATPAATTAGIGAVPTTAGASADTGGGTTPPGTSTPGTTTGATNTRLTLDVPAGGIGNNTPVILEGGNKGPATPENTGYTAAQLTGRQNYYNLMRDPNIAQFTSNINKTIAGQLAANKISQEQARGINEQLQALYQTPGTTQEAIRGLATTALRDATKAYATTSPAPAVSAAQNPDSASYVAGIGPADVYAPVMAEGGEVEDDMVRHLLEYRKGGGHHGPGQVKGIGSGQEDKIPAWLSDGEYVWSAQDVADLGDGSTDEGVRRLDKMRQMVRKRAGRKDVKKIAKPQRGIEDMLKAVGGRV